MKLHWYKMTPVGFCGLTFFCLCGLIFVVMSQSPELARDHGPLSTFMFAIVVVLGTPLIWLADYLNPRIYPAGDVVAFILLALNCYLWAFVIGWLVGKMDRKRA